VANWIIRISIVAVLIGSSAFAEELNPDEGPELSLELLEFIGNWQDKDGNWFDPEMLLEEVNNIDELGENVENDK